MSEDTKAPVEGATSSHPRLAELAVQRKQRKEEEKRQKARWDECQRWTNAYDADMGIVAEAMETLTGDNPSKRAPGFKSGNWVGPLFQLGTVVGKRGWKGIIRRNTGTAPEMAELICQVADGVLDQDGLRRELARLHKEKVLADVDWQYPLDEWRRGILGLFHVCRSEHFPDLYPPRPEPAASSPTKSDDAGEAETEPRDPAKPGKSRRDDILTAIRDANMPLYATEIQQSLKMRTPGKLRANLSWMVKNELLQYVDGKGYWLPDVAVPE